MCTLVTKAMCAQWTDTVHTLELGQMRTVQKIVPENLKGGDHFGNV